MQTRMERMQQAFREIEQPANAPLLDELVDNTEREQVVGRIFIMVLPPPPPRLEIIKRILQIQVTAENIYLRQSMKPRKRCQFCGGNH